MDTTDTEIATGGMSRRTMLKGAGAVAGVAWMTPVIAGTVLNPAAAGSAPGQTLPLIDAGQNPAACTGPYVGTTSGSVNVVNAGGTTTITVTYTNLVPGGTSYTFDVRCQFEVSSFVPATSGGQVSASLPSASITSPFYVDIAVAPGQGGTGSGNFGETFIAGPFTTA